MAFDEHLKAKHSNGVPSIQSCGDNIVDAVRMKLVSPDLGDSICQRVADKLAERSKVGQLKYGTKLTRTDLSGLAWLRHAQEEAMDLANYLEVLISRSPLLTRMHDMQEWALSIACELEVYIQEIEREERGAEQP